MHQGPALLHFSAALYPSSPLGNRNHFRCLFRQIYLLASCFAPLLLPATFSDLWIICSHAISSFGIRRHKSKHKNCKVLHFQNLLLFLLIWEKKKKKSICQVWWSHNCFFITGWWKLSLTQICAKEEPFTSPSPINLKTEEFPKLRLVFCQQPSGCCLQTAAQPNVPGCWAPSLCGPTTASGLPWSWDRGLSKACCWVQAPPVSFTICHHRAAGVMLWTGNHHDKPGSGALTVRVSMAGQNYHRVRKCWAR